MYSHFSNTTPEINYIYQQLKRKSDTADYEADSGDRMTSGSAEAANNPFQTPISGKTGKARKASKLTKGNRPGPQTPGSIIGEYCVSNFVW